MAMIILPNLQMMQFLYSLVAWRGRRSGSSGSGSSASGAGGGRGGGEGRSSSLARNEDSAGEEEEEHPRYRPFHPFLPPTPEEVLGAGGEEERRRFRRRRSRGKAARRLVRTVSAEFKKGRLGPMRILRRGSTQSLSSDSEGDYDLDSGDDRGGEPELYELLGRRRNIDWDRVRSRLELLREALIDHRIEDRRARRNAALRELEWTHPVTGTTAVHLMCCARPPADIGVVREFLRLVPPDFVSRRTRFGCTALHYAVANGADARSVRLLLNASAGIDLAIEMDRREEEEEQRCRDEEMPSGTGEEVRDDGHAQDSGSGTLEEQYSEAEEEAMPRSGFMDAVPSRDVRLFGNHLQTILSAFALVKTHSQKGSNVQGSGQEYQSQRQWTALHCAANTSADLSVMKTLLEVAPTAAVAADCHTREDRTGQTPLHVLCRGHELLMRSYLDSLERELERDTWNCQREETEATTDWIGDDKIPGGKRAGVPMRELQAFWKKASLLLRAAAGCNPSLPPGYCAEESIVHVALSLPEGVSCPLTLLRLILLSFRSHFSKPDRLGNLPLHVLASRAGETTPGCRYGWLQSCALLEHGLCSDSYWSSRGAERETVLDVMLRHHPRAAAASNGREALPLQLVLESYKERALSSTCSSSCAEDCCMDAVWMLVSAHPPSVNAAVTKDALYPHILEKLCAGDHARCSLQKSPCIDWFQRPCVKTMNLDNVFQLIRSRPTVIDYRSCKTLPE